MQRGIFVKPTVMYIFIDKSLSPIEYMFKNKKSEATLQQLEKNLLMLPQIMKKTNINIVIEQKNQMVTSK